MYTDSTAHEQSSLILWSCMSMELNFFRDFQLKGWVVVVPSRDPPPTGTCHTVIFEDLFQPLIHYLRTPRFPKDSYNCNSFACSPRKLPTASFIKWFSRSLDLNTFMCSSNAVLSRGLFITVEVDHCPSHSLIGPLLSISWNAVSCGLLPCWEAVELNFFG